MRAGVIAALVVVGGCSVASPSGSAAPSSSGDIATPPANASPSASLTNVRLARAGLHVVILSNGKAILENGAPMNITGQGIPATPSIEALTSGTDAKLVYVAARDTHSVIALASTDEGASWTPAGQKDVSSVDAIGELHVAALGDQFAILVDEAASSAVSSGAVAVGRGPGGKWAVGPAPVAGDISSAGGRYWIVGGVMGDQAFSSKDGLAWEATKIPASATYWTAALAVDVDGLGVVVPVTSHDPTGSSDVTFFATSDSGKTWTSVASLTAPLTEFNTTIPTSVTSDGQWFAVWPDGSRILVGSLGAKENKVISPNGLPANVSQVLFLSPTTGVAVGNVTACPDGKASCASSSVVTRTDDGGQTWTPIP
jgi:hypothetical protein